MSYNSDDFNKYKDAENIDKNTDIKENIHSPYKKISRKKKKKLIKLYRKGIASKEYIVNHSIDTNSYSFLYANFRLGGLSVIESFYNAIFISFLHRFDHAERKTNSELHDSFVHPKGWYKNERNLWTENIWSFFLHILLRIPLLLAKIRNNIKNLPVKINNFRKKQLLKSDNTIKRVRAFCKSFKNRREFIIPVLCALVCFFAAKFQVDSAISLDLYIDGNYIGLVKDCSQVISEEKNIEKAISSPIGGNYTYNGEITYRFSNAKNPEYLSNSQIYSALYDSVKKTIVPAYGLYIDDALIVASQNKAALTKALNEILDYYKQQNIGLNGGTASVSYGNNIRIQELDFPKNMLVGENDIRKTLGLSPIQTTTEIQKTYYISDFVYNILRFKNDVQSSPATTIKGQGTVKNAELSTDENVAASSDIDSYIPVDITLNYKITKEVTVTEDIDFDTTYVETKDLLEGSSSIKTRGIKGKQKSVYNVSYINSEETSRTLVSSEIIRNPVTQVIYVGTRTPTEEELRTMPTGKFIMPYEGKISSSYGLRYVSDYGKREYHLAWDIQGPLNATVVAADGGVVTKVSYTSGYGNHVIISHENGYETVYAHLNKATVKVGQRVAQGEQIGKMGRTGQATGIHVHLEIRKDGVSVDPVDYLGKRDGYNIH